MSSLQSWQQPYFNAFKYLNISNDKQCIKQGEIACLMDNQIKCNVYRITGATPASNFISAPKQSSSSSLGLNGKYLYLLFKPIPNKYFSFHLDIQTQEGFVLRLTFSNLIKEFKSTSTWLQFPYVIQAPKDSVYEKCEQSTNDLSGIAPPITKWTILCIDLINVLKIYANRTFQCVRGFKLCANLLVKNLITSDTHYEPGITHAEARLKGKCAFPRELTYPCEKYNNWYDHYDYIQFPSESNKRPFDSCGQVITNITSSNNNNSLSPKRINAKSNAKDIDTLTKPKLELSKRNVPIELPLVGIESKTRQSTENDIHVYPCLKEEKLSKIEMVSQELLKTNETSLEPDPILSLRKTIGSNIKNSNSILWTKDSKYIIYPCHAIIIAYELSTSEQHAFIGHTDKVSCLALNQTSTILISGQQGEHAIIRLWCLNTRQCLAMCKSHEQSLYLIDCSNDILCGIGKSKLNKTQICIWNIKDIQIKSNSRVNNFVRLITKATNDTHINAIKIFPFDNTRFVSCGKDNLKIWRLKDNTSLKSCSINLGPSYANIEFTDVSFDATSESLLYASTLCGHLFIIDYIQMNIKQVKLLHYLLDNKKLSLSINSISLSKTFLATASQDGYLRLWSLDLSKVCLEAEHDSSIVAIKFSPDESKLLTSCLNGNLGVLDILNKTYETLSRTHTNEIIDACLDPLRKQIATISKDGTIRIWDYDTNKQLYYFNTSSHQDELPTKICYSPTNNEYTLLACGFNNGKIKVFNIDDENILYELESPYSLTSSEITDLVYGQNGQTLLVGDSSSYLYLYTNYKLLRLLPNSLAKFGSLVVNDETKLAACIGSSEFLITIFDTLNLNELLRIDLTTISSSTNELILQLSFTSFELNQLCCITSLNRLIKFNAYNGKLISTHTNIYQNNTTCDSLSISDDSRFMVTTGDDYKIKVWNYDMNLDRNYQLFIGHSSKINKTIFTPDSSTLITIGDSICFWDFLAYSPCEIKLEPVRENEIILETIYEQTPRLQAPVPIVEEELMRVINVIDSIEEEEEEEEEEGEYDYVQEDRNENDEGKKAKLADKIYKAPDDKCGLALDSIIGYNGKQSFNNLIWNPLNGFFAYTLGCIVIIEDLNTGKQTHLKNEHNQDISCLALQNDGLLMASSSTTSSNSSIIVIWDISILNKKISFEHKNASTITLLNYSRDDRFLVSISQESLIIWNTHLYTQTASIDRLDTQIKDIAWNPFKCNEFVTCGTSNSLIFWLLDEISSKKSLLKKHTCEIPLIIHNQHKNISFNFTSLNYFTTFDSPLLLVSTNLGIITVWDIQSKMCFMHWKADTCEITSLSINSKCKLITSSTQGSLKLWNISSLNDVKRQQQQQSIKRVDSLTIENEIYLNSSIKCFKFDTQFDIGIVATRQDTLWYINWLDTSNVRLITTHTNRINSLLTINDKYLSTCSNDGTLRIWSLNADREQVSQFEVKTKALCQSLFYCDNKTFYEITKYNRSSTSTSNPLILVGYSDGSLRVFDLDKVNIVIKMNPLGNELTSIGTFNNNNSLIIVGSKDGILAIVNLKQLITLRVIHDHKGSSICTIDTIYNSFERKYYFLATSNDRRISIWKLNDDNGKCDIVDWITVSAPLDTKRNTTTSREPPCLAKFNQSSDTIIYTCYGLKKHLNFYNLKTKQIFKTFDLTEWIECMSYVPSNINLIALGTKNRLLQLRDLVSGSFQDYSLHSDALSSICFSNDGKRLFSASSNEIFIWNLNI